MKKRLFRLIVLFAVAFLFSFLRSVTGLAAAFDTIAGFETILKLHELTPSEVIYARLITPTGERKVFESQTNTRGEAQFEIRGDALRKAGRYRVEYVSRDRGEIIFDETFLVYPDSPSPNTSGIYPSNDRIAANGTPVSITIRLQDGYGNPIEGHEVLLTSSRAGDRIEASSLRTNENGNIVFTLRSFTPGVSTLTAHDETEKMTFEKRKTITFFPSRSRHYGSASLLGGFGGDESASSYLALADATPTTQAAQAARFEIKDLKASPLVNENLSFRVRALNAADGLVTGYRKTIEFSSTDPNATHPQPYTFQPSDLGEHTFDLSLSFQTAGRQTFTVKEKDNPQVKGEIEVDVRPARQVADTGAVSITKPTPGRYGIRDIDIEGQAQPNATVNIYDNGQQIGISRASTEGIFTFTARGLTDGSHAISAEANGILSQEVVITIAASASQVEELKLIPNPAGPNTKVDVMLRSQPNLDVINVTLADTVITLAPHPIDAGTYVGNFMTPPRGGNYPVDVQLVDRQGVEASYVEVATLVVDENLARAATFRVPSRVIGIRAQGGPSSVNLTWEPSTDDTGIAYYRIYYGIDRNNLSQIVNTSDARTTWYVPNLQEGVMYFFQIAGVDTEGNEGDQKSAIVGAVAGPGGVGVLAGGDFVPYPVGLPEDGPGILWLIFGAPGIAAVRHFLRRKKKR